MIIEEIEKNRIAWAIGDDKRDHDLTEPEDIAIFRDIVYVPDHMTEHLLDVYRPKQTTQKYPIILSIHGGGWFYGDKERYRFYCMHLAQMGFLVVNCNYRLMPEHPYPAAIEDVCSVVRWTLAQAEAYGAAPNAPWFMVGDSAGAQLVSQYCILAANSEYRSQLHFQTYDKLPTAVALNCGLYDMSNEYSVLYMQEIEKKQLELFQHELSYLNADFPPTYLMTSVNDDLRPSTFPMKEKLESFGVSHILAEYGAGVPEDGHVFHLNLYSKNGQQCNRDEVAFFQKFF